MEGLKEKKCFKCENVLSIDMFYRHPKTSDGFLNKCKICTKNDVKKNEEKLRQDPEWVAKEKKRGRDKYYRLGYKDLYKSTPEKKKEIMKRYNQKFPEKALARKYTEIYLTKNSNLHLHHWSYNQEDWLDVIQLSIKEHGIVHRNLNYHQEYMMFFTKEGVILDTKEKHLEFIKKLL
jgi:hypothetical protein